MEENDNINGKLEVLSKEEELKHYEIFAKNLLDVVKSGELEFARAAAGCIISYLSDNDIPYKEKFITDKQKNLTTEVREFVMTTSGFFPTTKCYRMTTVDHIEDKVAKRRAEKTAYMALLRLLEEGILERHPNKDGVFRRVDKELIKVDWKSASGQELPFTYALGIESLFRTFPKNIIVVASHPDGGKSAWLLDWVKRNQKKVKEIYNKPILYLLNDMGKDEFKERLEHHEDMTLDDWQLEETCERDSRFEDVILPDGVTIIDFVQEEAPYDIGTTFKRIHNKLTTGIVLVALQKPYGRDLGYGKEFGMQYPRFYMIFDTKRESGDVYGVAKILKCKTRRDSINATGKVRKFKLVNSWKFVPESPWDYPENFPKWEKF